MYAVCWASTRTSELSSRVFKQRRDPPKGGMYPVVSTWDCCSACILSHPTIETRLQYLCIYNTCIPWGKLTAWDRSSTSGWYLQQICSTWDLSVPNECQNSWSHLVVLPYDPCTDNDFPDLEKNACKRTWLVELHLIDWWCHSKAHAMRWLKGTVA